jgi:pseudaminic acid synthase
MNCYIGKKKIGSGCSVFIIAEMSGNHNGSLEQAIQIIHAAKQTGADAVKLQTYKPDTITLKTDNQDFKIPSESPWAKDEFLYDLYEKAYTPWEWHQTLFEEAKKVGLIIFSSPFDKTAVDLLEELDTPAYKIASPEITDIPLIKYVAQKGKPIILSTGMARKEDIELAIDTIRKEGLEDIVLLKCTSSYPTIHSEMNLRGILKLKEDFNCLIGLSDHSTDTIAPVSATALGASVIEKHFVISKQDKTVDSFFSLDLEEFTDMVTMVRNTEAALGTHTYNLPDQANMSGRRSLYIAKDIQKGSKITQNNIVSVRPGYGLHPKYFDQVIGKIVNKNLKKGDRLKLEFLRKNE